MADARRTAEFSLSELMDVIVTDQMSREVSAGRRATAVWLAANGDVERQHTTGVYLRDSRVKGQAPVLGVYLDSRMRVVDFSANKDLYVARVINQGLEISDIEFKLDRQGRAPIGRDANTAVSERQADAELPELSQEELEEVYRLTRDIPESFREVAQKAMIFSIRREKQIETKK